MNTMPLLDDAFAGAEPPDLPTGTVLQGAYRIIGPIASGSTGRVYEAAHERLAGRVAIKVLHPALLMRKEAVTRFSREAAIMSQLHHPNIVQVFDFDRTPGGALYLVMEYLEGGDLATELAQHGPLPLGEVVAIVKQIAGALTAAHRSGVVHRDLKPHNVMLQRAPGHEVFVKVLDFGLSSAPWAMRVTLDRITMGTPTYMAPEQALGRVELIDGRSDQFALAAIAYELLTGHEAFEGDDVIAVLYKVVHEAPPPLEGQVGWPSAGIEAVLLRGLAKRGEARFPTVQDFAEALETAAAAIPRRVAVRPEGQDGAGEPVAGSAAAAIPGLEPEALALDDGAEEPYAEISAAAIPGLDPEALVLDDGPEEPYAEISIGDAPQARFTRDELAWTGRRRVRSGVLLVASGLCLAGLVGAKGWREPAAEASFLVRAARAQAPVLVARARALLPRR